MSKDKTTMFVWGITAVLVIAMLGAAVYISLKNRPQKTATVDIAQVSVPIQQPDPVIKAAPLKPTAVIKREPKPVPKRVKAPEPVIRNTAPAEPVTEAEEDILNRKPVRPVDASFDLSRVAGQMSAKMKLVGSSKNKFPLRYTCYRNNFSPPVSWSSAPVDTKSFVIFLEKTNDGEDVVTNWMLFNISPEKTDVPENIPSPQYQGMRYGENYYDNPEYAGPCEPKDKQHYRIRVFALDTILDAPVGATRNQLIRAMNGHIIDMAEVKFLHYM